MTSGIYKLTFNNGQYYIGKSKDVERRWKEHWTKFQKGTAAKAMQECFNRYGYPSQELLFDVHQDHIDVIEPIVIDNYWGPNSLNTTKEVCAQDMQDNHLPLCRNSLGELCTEVLQLRGMVGALEGELESMDKEYAENLEEIKDGTALAKAERELKKFKEMFFRSDAELRRLRSRNFFQRLFNLN